MEIYYITKKDSETGKKFQELIETAKESLKVQKEFAKKYGFTHWRQGYWNWCGGMSSCKGFTEKPDDKVWEKGHKGDEYFPKANTKEGKVLLAEISAMPFVSYHDINMCIGYDGFPAHNIGFNGHNEEYFGIELMAEWGVKMPDDCEEVLPSKYLKMFEKENPQYFFV